MIGEDIALTPKIMVTGGFGAGTTTLVCSVSENRPLYSEETLSEGGWCQDGTDEVERKATPTVAMDFGRITVHSGLTLHRDAGGRERDRRAGALAQLVPEEPEAFLSRRAEQVPEKKS